MITVRKLTDAFGAEISGVDLSRLVSEAQIAEIKDAFHRHSLLIFRGQDLNPARQVEFSRHFGNLEVHVLSQHLLPGFPEILVISNIVENGKFIGLYEGDQIEWHSDLSWAEAPSLGSMLYAVEAPEVGGETWFAGMYAAYDALPAAIRDRINGLKAVHSLNYLVEKQRLENEHKQPLTEEQRKKAPDVVHPVVRTHPVTGRKSLYVGSMVVSRILGLDPAESDRLLAELCEHATKPEFSYHHRWQRGDLVFWDNRCTMHTVTPCDRTRYRRRLHRTTIRGDVPR